MANAGDRRAYTRGNTVYGIQPSFSGDSGSPIESNHVIDDILFGDGDEDGDGLEISRENSTTAVTANLGMFSSYAEYQLGQQTRVSASSVCALNQPGSITHSVEVFDTGGHE